MARTILIDGDINAFQVAASIETEVNWGDDEDVGVDLWTLHSDPTEGILRLDRQIEELRETLEADRVVVALSDTKNWRVQVLPTYKSNRRDKRRPTCLPVMRQHLRDTYEVFQRPGLEGDDVLGILATHPKLIPGEKIIVSLDKDMKTIPANIYRTSHPDDGIVTVTEEEADDWHLIQTLAGDPTDGYAGCPGVGMERAAKAIKSPAILTPYEHTITRGARKGEVETRYKEEPTEDKWAAVVSRYEAAGLCEKEALTQARVARILRHTDFDFKKKEPIPWTP